LNRTTGDEDGLMTGRRQSGWRRAFNRFAGLMAAIVGMGLILASFLFIDVQFLWYVCILGGLIIILFGFIYGANPFLTSERRYMALREEVDRFISLVRQLNDAATRSSRDEFERVKSEMVASVERMADLAGKEE
jgi:hypothetical protein